MDWTSILQFFRGPFFKIALLVFVGGMTYRLVRILLLGWKRDKVPSRGSKAGGVVKTYLKGLLVLPFIPWVRRTFTPNALTYIGGGLFHLSLVAVVVFCDAAHAGLEKPARVRLADPALSGDGLVRGDRHRRPGHASRSTG